MPLLHQIGLAMIVIFIGIDVYLAADGIKGNTWSELARWMGAMSPILPWAWGMLAGHFWHPHIEKLPFGHVGGIALLVWLSWLLVIIGIFCRQWGHPLPMWAPLIPGFFAGWFLWPVR